MRKILAAAAAAAMLTLSGCMMTNGGNNAMHSYDFTQMELIQLEPPKEGDTIAIVDTDMGEFRVVLYEEHAPRTAAQFIKLAQAGEYDNRPVYGVMTDMYFLTGGYENEKGAYTGRKKDSELIENECSVDLWPFKGALMSYSERTGYGDARWFVCNTDAESLTQEAIDDLKSKVTEKENAIERDNLTYLFDKFYEVGGVFGLSGTVTVFGQTYEGMETVEKLCALTSNENGRPYEEIMIRSVTISEYTTEENTNEA